MKKQLFIAAAALLALVGCSSDDFVGNQSQQVANGDDAISFTSDAGKATRATSNTGTVVQMLDGQFKVYGVKSGETAGTDLQKVFVNYSVWDVSSPSTTSNSRGWEYVGASGASSLGTGNISLSSDQTIKYWDHSAADYRFVAGSPISAFTFNINTDGSDEVADNTIESASVTGLSGHIDPNPSGSSITTSPVYIADPLIITEGSYSTAYGTAPVKFTFKRQQSRVRVGIYETIPGYKITEIHFYTNGSSTAATGTNIILTSGTADYFVGGSSAQVKGTLTYVWTGEGAPKYTFAYSNVDDADDTKKLKSAQNWYGGALTDGVKAVTSNHTTVSEFYGTDNDMDTETGYFTVLPTQVSTAAPLLIKCDYTLTSLTVAEGGDGSGETIKVKGATAAIPAAFSKWEPNTTYTYIFKISDNTNGSTGNSKVGLYPITFDAVATADANGTAQGYITTVSIPSITTYQAGSVTANGIQYVEDKDIYFTVQNNTTGELNTLNKTANSVGCVKVFYLGNLASLTTAPTEADLQVKAPTTEVDNTNPSGSTALSLPAEAWTNNGQSVAITKYGKFTPGADGYYAIQYLTTAADGETPAAYTYKIVKVVAAGS